MESCSGLTKLLKKINYHSVCRTLKFDVFADPYRRLCPKAVANLIRRLNNKTNYRK